MQNVNVNHNVYHKFFYVAKTAKAITKSTKTQYRNLKNNVRKRLLK